MTARSALSWGTIAALCVSLLVTACSTGSAATGPSGPTKLFAQPNNPLATAAAQWRAEGKTADAGQLLALAAVPQGMWLAGQSGEYTLLRTTLAEAGHAHELPTYVIYNLPHRDACGNFSSSDVTAKQYQAYVTTVTDILGQAPAIVIVEPDALPDLIKHCLTGRLAVERYTLLAYAMKALSADRRAHVFLDAGNPGMQINLSDLAAALDRAGIRHGAGFSANVSNFYPTATIVAWSQQLESELGGKVQAVVDTSRNGNGIYTGPSSAANPAWCNPPGRAVGERPTLTPDQSGVYAYLWVKNIWASDGPCNGGPQAGDVFPSYAQELGANGHIA